MRSADKKTTRKRAVEQGAGPSGEALARVAELQSRFAALKNWGMADHVGAQAMGPRWRDTVKWFDDWTTGKRRETSEIQGVTLDVKAMELAATEVGQRIGKPFGAAKQMTTFDPSRSTGASQVATVVMQGVDGAQSFVADAAKEARDGVTVAASGVPAWVIVLGAMGAGLFALSQVATISKALPARRVADVEY